MSTFVAAFYDAVLLYALALNDTLRQSHDPRGQLDGAAVIKNMWNRTFQGKLYEHDVGVLIRSYVLNVVSLYALVLKDTLRQTHDP